MRNNCLQEGGRGKSLQCMGEIQETVKKMPYAWNISAHSDGHFISCYELYLKRYN